MTQQKVHLTDSKPTNEVALEGRRELAYRRASRAPVSILSFGIILAILSTASGQAPLARLAVISVGKVADAEDTKLLSDGAQYVIRFRLEVPGDKGLYILSSGPKGAPPLGYALERRGSSIVWLSGASGEDQFKSPGIHRLTKEFGGRWVLLPASAAYEWEVEAEASRAGIEQSRSVFVRKDMNRPPVELISPWYTVGSKRRY